MLDEQQRAEFEILVRPLLKFINNNCHPHISVIITSTDAQLVEGIYSTGQIYDYILD